MSAAEIKKDAVTGVKVKDGSLRAADPQGEPGPRGEQGVEGAEGGVGPRGPSDAYYAFDNPASVDEKEVTLSVPAGSYVVNGSMGVASDDADDFANMTIGPVSNGHVEYRQATVQAAFSVGAAGGIITFYCEKFQKDAEPTLRRTQINAIKVEALH